MLAARVEQKNGPFLKAGPENTAIPPASPANSRNPSNASDGYLWWIGQPGDSAQPSETRISLPTGKPTIETIVEHGRTYVLAKVPLSMTGAQLHINPTGLPSTVAPLLPIDPSLADNFTATVFYALANGIYATVPFLVLFQVGFLYTGLLSIVQQYAGAVGLESQKLEVRS